MVVTPATRMPTRSWWLARAARWLVPSHPGTPAPGPGDGPAQRLAPDVQRRGVLFANGCGEVRERSWIHAQPCFRGRHAGRTQPGATQ